MSHKFNNTRRTVAQLRAALETLPDDAPVFVHGYEGGVDDLSQVAEVAVRLNANTAWYYGDHVMLRDINKYDETKHIKGFLIS